MHGCKAENALAGLPDRAAVGHVIATEGSRFPHKIEFNMYIK